MDGSNTPMRGIPTGITPGALLLLLPLLLLLADEPSIVIPVSDVVSDSTITGEDVGDVIGHGVSSTQVVTKLSILQALISAL